MSGLSKVLATVGAGSVVLAAALVIAVNAGADPATPTSPTTSTTPTTSTSSSAGAYPADARGYENTAARCEESQTLVSYGRTERALVAICVDRDGALQYRGVRLSDDAALQLPVNKSADGTLVATNDTVTYSISPRMLLVSDGDSVIYRDSWLEYKEPNFSGTTTSSSAVETTTVTATPTTSVSTTTVTVTTSAKPAS